MGMGMGMDMDMGMIIDEDKRAGAEAYLTKRT